MSEPTPIMEVIRGAVLEPKPDRLSMQHIELRDEALAAIEHAKQTMLALEELERGTTGGAQSPRHHSVRQLVAELGTFHHRLDDIYR